MRPIVFFLILNYWIHTNLCASYSLLKEKTFFLESREVFFYLGNVIYNFSLFISFLIVVHKILVSGTEFMLLKKCDKFLAFSLVMTIGTLRALTPDVRCTIVEA